MIDRDQVDDYSERKRMPAPTVEKWLAPSLSYDPDKNPAPLTPRESAATCDCGAPHPKSK